MATLDELLGKWDKNVRQTRTVGIESGDFEKLVKARAKKHTEASFRFFWASFTLQVIVYAMLAHVAVKYWNQVNLSNAALAGIFLYVPFTIKFMSEFRRLASEQPGLGGIAGSMYDHISRQKFLLQEFYRFKKWYEAFLIPLVGALGVYLVFQLYVPGGIREHWTGATVTFVLTLVSCFSAIRSENRKSFKLPIRQLQDLLDEFRKNGE